MCIRDRYCTEIKYEPENIETDSSTAKIISENGFLMKIKATEENYKHIYREIEDSIDVKSYETVEDVSSAQKKESAETPAPAAAPAEPEVKVAEPVPQPQTEKPAEPKPQPPKPAAPAAQTKEEINNKLAQKRCV